MTLILPFLKRGKVVVDVPTPCHHSVRSILIHSMGFPVDRRASRRARYRLVQFVEYSIQ
jgi:hypothetical protein